MLRKFAITVAIMVAGFIGLEVGGQAFTEGKAERRQLG